MDFLKNNRTDNPQKEGVVKRNNPFATTITRLSRYRESRAISLVQLRLLQGSQQKRHATWRAFSAGWDGPHFRESREAPRSGVGSGSPPEDLQARLQGEGRGNFRRRRIYGRGSRVCKQIRTGETVEMFTKLWYNDKKSKEKANMDNYLMIERLKKSGLNFDSGLSEIEIKKIESTFGFRFPKEIASFLSCAYPVGCNFFDYRDISQKNIDKFYDFQKTL